MKSVNIGQALSSGYATTQRYLWTLIGSYALYLVITVGLSNIPIVGLLATIFVIPPLAGGYTILFLKAARDQNPQVEDLFAGFRQYWKWMGVYWLFIAAVLLAMIPFLIMMGIAMAVAHGVMPPQLSPAGSFDPGSTPIAITLGAIGGIISLVIVFIIVTRYIFAFYLVADGLNVLDAFKESARMTNGIRLQVLGAYIVFALVSLAGLLALGVGIIVTGVIATLAFTYVYLDVRAASLSQPTA